MKEFIPPQNLHETRMQQLIAKRFALKKELAEVDEQIGKLDIVIGRSKPQHDMNYEPIDLDDDAMYKPRKFVDPSTQAYIETVHNLNRGKDRQGNPLFKKPPYDLMLQ